MECQIRHKFHGHFPPRLQQCVLSLNGNSHFTGKHFGIGIDSAHLPFSCPSNWGNDSSWKMQFLTVRPNLCAFVAELILLSSSGFRTFGQSQKQDDSLFTENTYIKTNLNMRFTIFPNFLMDKTVCEICGPDICGRLTVT